jgi:hypothetical protein
MRRKLASFTLSLCATTIVLALGAAGTAAQSPGKSRGPFRHLEVKRFLLESADGKPFPTKKAVLLDPAFTKVSAKFQHEDGSFSAVDWAETVLDRKSLKQGRYMRVTLTPYSPSPIDEALSAILARLDAAFPAPPLAGGSGGSGTLTITIDYPNGPNGGISFNLDMVEVGANGDP